MKNESSSKRHQSDGRIDSQDRCIGFKDHYHYAESRDCGSDNESRDRYHNRSSVHDRNAVSRDRDRKAESRDRDRNSDSRDRDRNSDSRYRDRNADSDRDRNADSRDRDRKADSRDRNNDSNRYSKKSKIDNSNSTYSSSYHRKGSENPPRSNVDGKRNRSSDDEIMHSKSNSNNNKINTKSRLTAFCKLLSKPDSAQNQKHQSSDIIELFQSDPGKQNEKDMVVLNDKFSRGIKADLTSVRDLPYHCSECNNCFMVATQLQIHLRTAHNIIKHASLLKPATSRASLINEAEGDNIEDDYEEGDAK